MWLPTSAIAAFIAVWLCGFTLNFMTLLGLSLAIGVLIDDAIVVRENIVRHMERGEDRMTAARNGTAEIGLAVTATTLSIVAVLVPVAFMGGGAGEWFRPFAVTVAASVLVSLFISFTLDPMLSAYWGDPPGHAARERQGLEKYFARFNTWFDHQANRYGKVIEWCLHHRKWMASGAVLLLVGAITFQVRLAAAASSCPSPTTARWPSKYARRRAPVSSTRAARWKRPRSSRATCPRPRTPTRASMPRADASGWMLVTRAIASARSRSWQARCETISSNWWAPSTRCSTI